MAHEPVDNEKAFARLKPKGPRKRVYARIESPTMEALAGGHFTFKTQEQAKTQLDKIRRGFVLARQVAMPEMKPEEFVLWIRGWAVSEEEAKQGFLGHYARVGMREQDGQWLLTAEKLEIPLKQHPQKQRRKQRHPNWGHPVLRSATSRRWFATAEEAQKQLDALREEYPHVTIPGPNRLHVIVFSRKHGGPMPVQKIILEIKVEETGGFYIEWRESAKPFQPRPQKGAEGIGGGAAAEEAPAQPGYFASLVSLKRKGRKEKKEIRDARETEQQLAKKDLKQDE